jgi:hypothetical protein
MHSRAAELAVIEHFLATHGVTRCPVAFAVPVAGVLSPAQEAEWIASPCGFSGPTQRHNGSMQLRQHEAAPSAPLATPKAP